ncbi:hypothetical protein GALMADRAFT_247708 [Galerina marginata CBS 339.88]|uniref:DUF6699 domain-containing protein n=1 Tax=Galerina marginata (strain CBS 339.88) TaxID=685588 RepID=A0A067SZK9_GALM3|nr:hypothetical protein GALMADRAFT_247708 [Galerina marginata CBS 339.88]
MARPPWVEEYNAPSSWPIESILGPLMHDESFLSHLMFPDMPDARHVYSAPELLQYPYPVPQVIHHVHARTQYARARGGKGSVGRRRKPYRESYGRYTTLARNITLPQTNHSYRPPSQPRASYEYYASSHDQVPLSRKPRTWRKGYKSPSKRGLGQYFGGLTSLVMPSPSFRMYRLHPLISYRSRQPTSLVYNLRHLPGPGSHLLIKALGRPADALDLYQLATTPPTHRMLIWHPKLPWKIKIETRHPISAGITIQDVLNGIYEQLRHAIEHHDFYTIGLASADRELISGVFHERCAGDPREIGGGVRRVDFLGQEFCFVGLSRSRNGTWEMKTAVPQRERMTLD